MAIYLIAGKLGSGKTLASVGQIRDKLKAGCRVATNLDLHLDVLLPPRQRDVSCVRLPDKPTVDDFTALGCGNVEMDETRNGIIVLDELASWLNSRTFNDKSRAPVIDWLLHSRKHGWDVFFIAQHIEQIDKQIRTALVEYLVTCRRLDRLRVPFVGGILKACTGGLVRGMLPKVHVATVRYGCDSNAIVADRWVYQAKELYASYETRQVFTDAPVRLLPWGECCGAFSYLSPWHLGGWRLPSRRDRLLALWRTVVSRVLDGPPRRVVDLKPKLPLVASLAGLPSDEAVRAWRALDQRGLI